MRGPGWATTGADRRSQLPRTGRGERGLGEVGVVKVKKNEASLGGGKNVLKLIILIDVQNCKYSKSH